MVCKDYSQPKYSAELKRKVASLGGGCTGDCNDFSVVLPANINWNIPGVYDYYVTCTDSTGECTSTDTGRLVIDWNCGCGPCGCSQFC